MTQNEGDESREEKREKKTSKQERSTQIKLDYRHVCMHRNEVKYRYICIWYAYLMLVYLRIRVNDVWKPRMEPCMYMSARRLSI